MKTRTTKRAPVKKAESQDEQAISGKELPPSSTNPPMVFILPNTQSPDARIVTLPNPATSRLNRYYICPDRGVYEFTKVAAPRKTPGSWLFAPEKNNNAAHIHDLQAEDVEEDGQRAAHTSTGHVIEQPDLFVATPMDPLFLLLPVLAAEGEDTHKQLFLSIDDHLDALAETSQHLKHILRNEKLRKTLGQRVDCTCDSVDVGEDKMYRLSEDRLAKELVSKAEKVAKTGLPASMERRFVQEALQVPVRIQTQVGSEPKAAQDVETANKEGAETSLESQTSTTTSFSAMDSQVSQTSIPSIYTEATSIDGEAVADPKSETVRDIADILKIRTALDFLLSSYIPSKLRNRIQARFSGQNSLVDFGPLDTHLARLATLRKEQQALRSLSDNISRKRSNMDDEEADEARAQKKRKKEEEDVKKKNQSRGVKQLSKVNTTGMSKMSSFFSKAPAKQAKG